MIHSIRSTTAASTASRFGGSGNPRRATFRICRADLLADMLYVAGGKEEDSMKMIALIEREGDG